MANTTSLWDQMMGGKSAEEATDFIDRLREKQTSGLEDYKTGAIAADDLNDVTQQELNVAKASARNLGALPEQLKLGVEENWKGREALSTAPKFSSADEALKAEEALKFSKYQDTLDVFKKANPESPLPISDKSTYIDDLTNMLGKLRSSGKSTIGNIANKVSDTVDSSRLGAFKIGDAIKHLDESKLGRTVKLVAPTTGKGLGVLGTASDLYNLKQDIDTGDTRAAGLDVLDAGLNIAATKNPILAPIALARFAGDNLPRLLGHGMSQSDMDRREFAYNKRLEEEKAKGINILPHVDESRQSEQKDVVPTDVNKFLSELTQSEISRDPSSVDTSSPSKSEVVAQIIQSAKEHGVDPTLTLAQIEHESPGFRLNQVSKTGAKGLGQMFPLAVEEAKQMDKSGKLGNLSYDDLSNPKNWKQQIDASILYNKAIAKRYNKSGSTDEQLQRYVGGPTETLEQIKKRGTDAVKYIKEIKAGQEKWKNILGDEDVNQKTQVLPSKEINRSPAISKPELSLIDKIGNLLIPSASAEDTIDKTEEDKARQNRMTASINSVKNSIEEPKPTVKETEVINQQETPAVSEISDKQRILNFLRAKDDLTDLKGSGPLVYGPGFNSPDQRKLYAQHMASSIRLRDMKSKYKELQSVQPEVDSNSLTATSGINPNQAKLDQLISSAKVNGLDGNLMLQALRDKSENTSQANMLRALSQITTGLAGMGGKGKNVAAKNEGDKYFEDLVKQAGEPVEDVKLQIAADKEDPNSKVSNSLRSIISKDIEKLGYDVKSLDGLAYTQLHDLQKQLDTLMIKKDAYEDKKLTNKEKSEKHADEITTKRFDTVGKLLVAELANSRSTFGTDARTLAASHNIKALFNGVKSLDNLQSSEVYEVAKGLDRILSQGSPTVRSTEKLTPETARSWASDTLRKVTNTVQGAGAGDFLKKININLNNEEAMATGRIREAQQRLLASYSDLKEKDPEKWALTMRLHGFGVDPFQDVGPAETKFDETKEIRRHDPKNNSTAIFDKNKKFLRWE